MSYYTCLSHSTTADGAIIMQGFDPSIITRGCSGYLRQEFREHEILNNILLDLDMKVFCLIILKAQLEIQLLDSISNGKVNIIFQIKLI